MALPLAVSERDKVNQHLDKLSDILRLMRNEIKAPVDERIEDALFEILLSLRLMLGE